MKKLLLVMMAIMMILALAAAGCGEQAAEKGEDGANGSNGDNGEEIGEQRIVSLIPGNTEILFALGLGDSVVGVTDLCNYPPEMETAVAEERIQRVGDAWSLNEELIVSLEPTLVLFGSENEAAIERLNSLGIETAVIYPLSISEVIDCFLTIGELTGRKAEARLLYEEMETGLDEIKAKTAALTDEEKPRVLFIIDLEWLFVVGSGNIQDELITLAGGVNVMEIAGYGSVNKEAIIESQPDLILGSFPYRDQILEMEEWKNIPAVRDEAIFDLDGDLVTRPTPRLVEGLRQLLAILHPEL